LYFLLCPRRDTDIVGILAKHQLWPSQGATVGASGGLFGLLGAALVLVSRLPSQSPVARIGLMVVLAVGLTYSVFPGISMTGHIIGLTVGSVLAFLIPSEALTPSVRR
jgi:membrane associated rhomboid family serine protease